MEVCIFGVLTVNLLTFSSSERSSPIRTPSPPMSVKGDWLSLGRKSSNALLQPVLQAYMKAGTRHK